MNRERKFIEQMFESLNNPNYDFSKEELMNTEELEKVKKIIESPPKNFEMEDKLMAQCVYATGRKLDYEVFKIKLKKKGIKL